MRRILLVLTVAAVMASMMVLSAVPAFAQIVLESKDDKLEVTTPAFHLENKDDKVERDWVNPLLPDSERKEDKLEIDAEGLGECKIDEGCTF